MSKTLSCQRRLLGALLLSVLAPACGPMSLKDAKDVTVSLVFKAPSSDAPTTSEAQVHLDFAEPSGGCRDLNFALTVDGQAGTRVGGSSSLSTGGCASMTFDVKPLTPASTTTVVAVDGATTVRAVFVDACAGQLVRRGALTANRGEPVELEWVASVPLDPARVQVESGSNLVPFTVDGHRLRFTMQPDMRVRVWRAGWTPVASTCEGAARCEASCDGSSDFASFSLEPTSP